jgi:hypothetical protein
LGSASVVQRHPLQRGPLQDIDVAALLIGDDNVAMASLLDVLGSPT